MSSGESDYLRDQAARAAKPRCTCWDGYEVGGPTPGVSPDCAFHSYTTRTIPVVQAAVADKSALPAASDKCAQISDTLFPAPDRKEYPLFTGWLRYFPHAHAAASRCSHIANEQHNPGEPVHWDKSKSIGEGNELLRHLLQAGTRDADGQRHSVKVLWRAAELVEREILAEIAAGTYEP